MKKTTNQKSIQIGKTIARATAKAFQLDASAVVTLFDNVRSEILTMSLSASDILESRRRIAEATVSVLATKTGSTSAFETAWNEIKALGFSDTEREATMLAYYAQFMLANGGDEQAITSAISRLGNLLLIFRESRSEDLLRHFQQVYEKLAMQAKRLE